jgi:peptide chain release factor 3
VISSTTSQPETAAIARETGRRRTFAVISHPDAGKTTLTEKLLLYAGAVVEAGQVKARRGRRAATSDWMEMERQRGISVSSTVLRFQYGGSVFNLLDTPGHRDFSEDTLRVLAAVDSAVILLDAAKGVEPQTLKLFEVARERGIPLITFVNKYDRPGLEPLELLDDIERRLGITPAPVTWPVGLPGEFVAVVDRRDGAVHRFERTPGGSSKAGDSLLNGQEAESQWPAEWKAAQDELALLDAVGANLAVDSYLAGESTPTFFGSAISNFGVELLLRALIELAPSPGAIATADGGRRAVDAPFSGFVFKVQANLDPRHRDRVAFVRICSGRFRRGMRAIHAPSGRPFAMNYASELFGQERETIDEAFPGDVIGVVNALDLRVGDTLYEQPAVEYPPIPMVAPEHFVRARNANTARYKQFHRGLSQLDEEGVVQVLRDAGTNDQTRVLAGAGPMQFEVAAYRLEHEFGGAAAIELLPYRVARRTDSEGQKALGGLRGARVFERFDGTLIAAFEHEFSLHRFERDNPGVMLDKFLIR